MFVGGWRAPKASTFPHLHRTPPPCLYVLFQRKRTKGIHFSKLFSVCFFTEKVWVDVGLPQTTHREGTGPSCHSQLEETKKHSVFDPRFLHL